MVKKFLSFLFVLFVSSGISFAQNSVNNGTQLNNAIRDSSDPQVEITNSFVLTDSLTPRDNKNVNINFSESPSAITISGNDQYKAFELKNSTLNITGFPTNVSTITFTSFYNEFSSGAVVSISSRSYVSISSVTFSSNTALAGGVFYSSGTNFDIESSTFTLNTALSDGGAFYIEYSTGSFRNIIASSNTAAGHGGFLFADKSSFTVIKGTISYNSAGYGGALSVSSSTFLIDDVYFASNTATSAGGSLYVMNSSTFSVRNSTFTGNSASEGGAGYFLSSSSATFKNIYITNNEADKGAVFYLDNSWDIDMDNLYVSSNSAAQSGGAFYLTGSTDITMIKSQFLNNTAADSGGVIFAENSEFYLDAVYAKNNSADKGGAFYVKSSTALIGGSTFENNIAQDSGGVVYSEDSYTSLSHVVFTGNQALSMGGAVYSDGSDLAIESGNFNFNTAASGGAVYVKDSEAVLRNVSFANNSASANGGAVFVDNSKVTVNGGTFSNNAAASKGGAFYVSSGGELILNAVSSEIKFASNTAGGTANDIYLENNTSLTLNARNNITLSGGINHAASPSSISVDKTGAGNLYLGGTSVLECDFNLLQGGFILSEAASLSMKNLTVNAGNKFSAGKNSTVNVNNTLEVSEGASLTVSGVSSFNANTLNMYGTLTVGVDLKNGTSDVINANVVNLSSGSSKLELGGNLSRGASTFTVVDATSINGDFSASSGTYGSRISWNMNKTGGDIEIFVESLGYDELRGLNYNQQQAANLINDQYDNIYDANNGLWQNVISPLDGVTLKELTDSLVILSGSFYADLFKIPVISNQKRNMFGQIRRRDIADRNSWIQASGSLLKFEQGKYSAADFEDTSLGVQAGWDLINDDGIIGGLTIGYQYHDIEQGVETATVNALDAGAYGAWVKDAFELKGILALGYQSYETERELKALNTRAAKGSFSGYSATLNAQAGYNLNISKTIKFKPFIELGAAGAMNDKVEEEGGDFGLKIDSQNYFYSDALLGIGFNGDHNGRISWYVNAGAGYALTDTQNEIETEFLQSDGTMKVKGSEMGDTIINAGCGVEVTVSELIYVYASAGYGTSDGYENMHANVGVKYKLLK